MLTDNMPRGDEQIGAGIGDPIEVRGPHPRIGFLHNLIDVARFEAAQTDREPAANVMLVGEHLARKPSEPAAMFHHGRASLTRIHVKPSLTLQRSNSCGAPGARLIG